MSLKPTVIKPATELPVVTAVPVGQPASEGVKPTVVAPSATAPLRPTAIEAPAPKNGPTHLPTALGTTPKKEAAPMSSLKVTSLFGLAHAAAELPELVAKGLTQVQQVAQEGTNLLAKAITPSALPGIRREGLDVPIEELGAELPQASPEELRSAKGVLSGVVLEPISGAQWLEFGQAEQEELAFLVRARLEASQTAPGRTMTQHLTRLQNLLSDVLDSFEGGLFRKSPEAVWQGCKQEVLQLETLLNNGIGELRKQLKGCEKQRTQVQALAGRIRATSLAAEYLCKKTADPSGVLLSRVAALTSSQALLAEHLQHLENDITMVQELMSLVQAGVLVKLPAVYLQLATVTGKPTETQRFLAAEKLNDVLTVINQRKTV